MDEIFYYITKLYGYESSVIENEMTDVFGVIIV